MHFTPSIIISAFLAGQVAIAAYIPHRPRDIITRTQVRTVYSTKVVFASPSVAKPSLADAGVGKDGLPFAPSISRLSIPLSSIFAVDPINGLPLQTVKQTAKATKPAPAPAASAVIPINPINGLPLPIQKPAPTSKPAPAPNASAAAVAGIANIIAQAPRPSASKQATAAAAAAAAAGIADIIAQAPKSKPTPSPSPIIIQPVPNPTPKPAPKPTSTKRPGPLFSSLMSALPKPFGQLPKAGLKSSTVAEGIVIVPVMTNSGAPLLVDAGPTPAPNVPVITPNKEEGKDSEANRVLSILEAAQPRNN